MSRATPLQTTPPAPAADGARGRLTRAMLPALLLLAAGVLITLWMWQDARQTAQAAAVARFEYRAERIRGEFEHHLESYETTLRSVAALISSGNAFDRAQWRRYFDTIGSGHAYPGQLVIGYAPRVSAADVPAHERQVHADGLASYAVQGGERPVRFPLAYARRAVPQEVVPLGTDLAADPVAADAMTRSAAEGRTILAGPLAVSRSRSEEDQVWALFVPVYAAGPAPRTPPERERALMGFVIETFNPMTSAGSTLGPDATLIGLKVHDGALPLFTCPEMKRELAAGFTPTLRHASTLEFGERRWMLEFVALPKYMAAGGAPDRSSRWVLAGGLVISALLAGLVGALASRRERAQALVAERTSELREALALREASETYMRAVVDHALDAVIIIDAKGAVRSFNPAAERIFGYTAAQVIGRNVHMLMTAFDRDQHDGYMDRFMKGGAPRVIGIGRVVTGRRQDGSTVPLDLGVTEMNIGGERLFCGFLRDITERMAAEEALLRSERKLRSYIEQSLDGVLVVDDTGRFLECNPATIEMLGYAERELLSMAIADILWPEQDNQRAGAAHFQRVVSTGRSKGEVVLKRKSGERIVTDINAVALGGHRYLGIVRDTTQRRLAEEALQRERGTLEQRVKERTEVLTQTNHALEQEIVERKRVQAELVAAREQALQAADAKAGFLANMSHEIRTPMNAVIGMTALLEETPLASEQRGYLETIRVSGEALLAIINDVLDFSKIESGMLELERQPFELGACIEEAVSMLGPKASQRDIDLLYVLADDMPKWIVGDATRLRQVLINLLSNAVKFTEPGGEVCLTASKVAVEGDQVRLQFAVRDTGIGIAPSQRAHLFKAFSQADSSTTRKYGGTGLGLAICQRLVRLMGGDIWLDSQEQRGSTFFFTVTAGMAREMQAARYVLDRVRELTGRSVLVVDDNATNVHILQTQCRRWGLDVATAGSGREALAMFDSTPRRFDVAVLDLHMPGMDGVQLAQQIRWRHPGSVGALVLLSSSSAPFDDATLSIFAARLPKPVRHSQLFALLGELLHPGFVPPSAAAAAVPRLDATLGQRHPMKILVVEDSAINQKLAVGILAKLGYESAVADNGVQALELVRRHRYDLVLMDLQMPEMDGLEATRRIVAEVPPTERPRIVAMTANALPGDRERCLQAGMDDYLAKPILPADVQALIERWARADAPAPPPLSKANGTELAMIDTRIVQELQALDAPGAPSLLRSLVNDYLAEAPHAIGEIKRHTEAGDAAGLAQRVHKLAGVSASLGAGGVAEVCRRIEQKVSAGELDDLGPLVDQLELRFARTRSEVQRLL
jgi:PAS domain S-box-containing protein